MRSLILGSLLGGGAAMRHHSLVVSVDRRFAEREKADVGEATSAS
jgi:hypothetical protein